MAGALALVGAPLALRRAGPDRAVQHESDEGKRATLVIATVLTTAFVGLGWLGFAWALGGCSDISNGSSVERYCDFLGGGVSDPPNWPIYAIVTAAPFITVIGGVLAIRRNHLLPLAIGTAIGLAIVLAAALPFRLA